MDPTEITKHIPELAKAATAVAASIPFTAVVKRMLGPAADELAEMLRDSVRLYRYERQIKCLEKAERMAQEAGFTPQAVPPKILFPLLEGASFEDNEDLHTMWAALLANAASPENSADVRPGFIAILKQMAPDEAMLLKWAYEQKGDRIEWPEMKAAYVAMGFSEADLDTSVGALEATRLIHAIDYLVLNNRDAASKIINEGLDSYRTTDRGHAFIDACRPPKPK